MNDGALWQFLASSTAARLELVRAGTAVDTLRAYLGDAACREYEALAATLDSAHLAVGSPPNLVFLPGIMGTQLYSHTKGGVWWVDTRTRDHIDDLALAVDGRGDADPSNDVRPFTTDPQYEPFMTAVLSRPEFGHEIFPYDWRKLPSESAAALRDLVLRMHADSGQPVHLVAHSMGGLVVRATLAAHGDELRRALGRIVFLGTPHHGSPAIAGYLKNHLWGFELLAVLGLFLSRATFRSLWGALSLLPAPVAVYPDTRAGGDHPCANFDLYRAEEWKLDLDDTETTRLQRVLDGVAEAHRRRHEAHEALLQERRDEMLVIAGVGYKTLFRLEYESRLFGAWTRMKKITDRAPGNPHREGDGRVPLASAALENVPIRYVKAVHGGLPNVPAVYEDVFRFLLGQDLQLARTPAEALSGHLAVGDEASVAPHLDGSAAATGSDPGYLDLEPPQEAAMAVLRTQLERGELPAFTRVRLL